MTLAPWRDIEAEALGLRVGATREQGGEEGATGFGTTDSAEPCQKQLGALAGLLDPSLGSLSARVTPQQVGSVFVTPSTEWGLEPAGRFR